MTNNYPRSVKNKIAGKIASNAREEHFRMWEENDSLVFFARGFELVVPFQEMKEGTWEPRIREFVQKLRHQRKVDRATKKANSKWLWKHYYD